VFAFSALYTLFASIEDGAGDGQGLARKDRLRMEQWREETDMVAFSDKERERFLQKVIGTTSMDRFTLLLESNLERISNIASGTREWVLIGKNLLQKNDDKVKEALKKDLGNVLDGFFDVKYGDIGQAIFRFVEGYNLSSEDYREELEKSGFLPTLYRVFQVLQQATNRFIAESIHPKLVEFVAGEEERIENVFNQVTGPYGLMIQDAVDQHRRTMEKLGIQTTKRDYNAIRPPAVALTKADARLTLPRLASTMRYSARIKTEAILRLGFYNTLKTAKKFLKKSVAEGPDTAIRSLEDSVRKIKEQIQDSIADHFMDYKENIKYQYIFKLVDAMSSRLYETLTDNMMAFTGNLSDMKGVIENQRVAKGHLPEQFDSMEQSLKAVLEKIKDVERLTASEPL
jgi:hypothetical protein